SRFEVEGSEAARPSWPWASMVWQSRADGDPQSAGQGGARGPDRLPGDGAGGPPPPARADGGGRGPRPPRHSLRREGARPPQHRRSPLAPLQAAGGGTGRTLPLLLPSVPRPPAGDAPRLRPENGGAPGGPRRGEADGAKDAPAPLTADACLRRRRRFLRR